jgi:protein O-mannosyl-transferase
VAAVFAFRAHARNEDWNDELKFWDSAVQAVPGSFKPKISIIGSLPRNTVEGWQRGIAETQRALATLDPLPDDQNSGGPYRNAGVYYRAYGDALGGTRAFEWYRKSLDALLRSERIERKLDEQYRAINEPRGIKQWTYLPVAGYRELGITYLRLRQFPSALQALEFGRRLASDPDLLEALAAMYGEAGDARKSALALVEALAVDSSRGRVAEKLITLYKQIDPGGCAVQRDAGGESLNLACPMVHNDVCEASKNVALNYARRNQTAEAASIRRVAINDLGCAAASLD